MGDGEARAAVTGLALKAQVDLVRHCTRVRARARLGALASAQAKVHEKNQFFVCVNALFREETLPLSQATHQDIDGF